MIVIEKSIEAPYINENSVLAIDGIDNIYRDALFFDLEHYVYKKPICIGVFGCCYYDENNKNINVTQYMIENKSEIALILKMARDYFIDKLNNNKRYIVTFSGNNDFTVINYLFKKYNINFNFEPFKEIDIQNMYQHYTGMCIGLKPLEKIFNISRENELISGSNLAKTFSKLIRDEGYFQRMPVEKVEKILQYNRQDVVSLFYMLVKWNDYIKKSELEGKKLQ